MMMGVGILVLLLLIIGIGSALKAPRPSSSDRTAYSGERVLILQAMRPIRRMGCSQRREPRLRKILSRMFLCHRSLLRRLRERTPAATDGQQRVEVQGDLNNALTQPQNQQQLNNVAVNSTLPTEPATVAPVRNGNASRETAKTQTAERPATTRPARQQAVIEPKKSQATVKTEPKPVAQTPKRTEPAALWRARRHRLRLLRQHQKRRRLRAGLQTASRRKPRQHQPLEGRPQVMLVR